MVGRASKMNFASAFLLLVCVVSIAGRAASSGKMCGSPLLPLKGQVTGGVRPAYELGGFVEYICDYGFVNGGGPTVAVCIYSEQRGAHWNLPPPNCIPIDCGNPDTLLNGRVSVPNGTTLGAKTWYFCSEGFVLFGTEFLTCNASGKWTPATPYCTPEPCRELLDPANGQVSYTADRSQGSIATYYCDEGYQLEGSSVRTCQDDGKWSGRRPSCIVTDCGPPEVPLNGRADVTNGTTLGQRAWYFCHSGYVLFGVEFRTCQPDEKWVPDVPVCKPEPLLCLPLGDILKGGVLTTGFDPGSIGTYTCNYGYRLVGNPTRTCQNDGEWSGSVPFCTRLDCGPLTSPVNGHIDIRSIKVGGVVQYKCDLGYHLVGAEFRTCRPDSLWSDEPATCQPVDCGRLDYPDKGAVTLSGTHFNSTASYYCISGYVVVGESKRLCLASGQWSGYAPICVVADCGYLPAPENGAVKLSATTVGGRANYNCNEGYMLEGQYRRECAADGKWSGEAPECEAVFCKKLHHPASGLVRLISASVGAMAMYECFSGYVLIGDQYRTCLPNSVWSGYEPVCKYIDCGYLSAPEYAVISQSGNNFGSKARYKCRPGFLLIGDEIRTCEANGLWSGYEPNCKFQGCDYLSVPDNGQVVVTGVTLSSTATYSCNHGYMLSGKHLRRVCRPNGEWSGSAPTCIPAIISCPYLGSPSNGHAVQSGTSVHSTVTYHCQAGYILVGDRVKNCLPSGQWSGAEPVCRAVECPDLLYPDNGKMVLTTIQWGGVATYSCNQGYILVGAQTRQCEDNGHWSNQSPVCKILQCPELEDPQNGKVVLSGTTVGSRASYNCGPKFTFVGDLTRTCLPDATWSGSAPTCIPTIILCPYLGSPSNGHVVQSGTSVHSTVTYRCQAGYILVGDRARDCLPSGQWSGAEPVCQALKCPELEDPQNGRVVLSGTTVGSTAEYSCGPKFTFIGSLTRTCLLDGTWSGRAPRCNSIDCGSLDDPQNGRVLLSGTTCDSIARYSCSSGFKLVGDALRTCLSNAAWSGEAPFCRPIVCSILEDPENGKAVLSGNSVGSTAKYSCSAGYLIAGDKLRSCQPNGEWSGIQPACRPIMCETLVSPDNGRLLLGSTSIGSTAVYLCNNGFQLEGDAFRTCQTNGMWSHNEPRCTRVQCGVLQAPSDGYIHVTGIHYGDTATYFCHQSYHLTGKADRSCLASGYWSGAAAECMREGVKADCSLPSAPENGYAYASCTHYGCRASHWCNSGYFLYGSRLRVCQQDNQWSGSTPNCKQSSYYYDH